MTNLDPEAIRKSAEFDRLMAAANLQRMRGDYAQAAQLVKQALQIAPNDLDAREFAADLLAAHGGLEKAAAEYRSIFTEDASRSSAEEKFAKITVQIAEAKRQRELLKDMLEHPAQFRTPARSPLVAALLSAAPGFGQIYCGQYVKGIVIFLVTMFFWLLFYLTAPDVSFYPQAQRALVFMKDLSAMAVIFACLATFIQVYAFVDAPVTASKMRSGQPAGSPAEPE